jgi:HEAT repeat protein
MLLEMTQAENAADRAQALSRLTIEGRADDEAVRAALEAGVTDANPEVRAQALNGLAHREGAGAAEALQAALRDESADVRLMAVESAGLDAQGVAVLQQALADKDSTVRALAEIKLQEARQAEK